MSGTNNNGGTGGARWTTQSTTSQSGGAGNNPTERSPTVNYINITRRPEGGIVNIEMKRHEGLSRNPFDSEFGSQSGVGGSGYSSPRSSIGSGGGYDSKGSSPHTVVITHPPLPDHQRGVHGGLLHELHQQRLGPHSIIISPRSSISSMSGDSKHSSPRSVNYIIFRSLLFSFFFIQTKIL